MSLSAGALYHQRKRRALLAAHPSLRSLLGNNPWSLLFIALLASLQFCMAWLVRDGGVWRVFLAAFCVGQVILHAAGALVHEAAHGLILRRHRLLVDVVLEWLLTSFGHHAQYQLDHILSHHPYLGDYERDYEHKDVCRFRLRRSLRAARPQLHRALIALQLLLDLLPGGFLFSDDLVASCERAASPLVPRDRARLATTPRLPRRRRLWLVLVSLASVTVVGVTLGPYALLYWLWSLSIFQGRAAITNIGQVLSEHSSDEAVTQSYYGAWNLLLFNTGYHDEHHTFPMVPWNRLPKLRRQAPEGFVSASPHGYFTWWYLYVFKLASRRPLPSGAAARCSADPTGPG